MLFNPRRCLVALLFICSSCQSGVHTSNEATADHKQGIPNQPAAPEPGKELQAAVGELTAHYFHVKDGLAADNAKYAADGAVAMNTDLTAIEKSAAARNNSSLQGTLEQMRDMAEHIANGADEISHQREHFNKLSERIISLVRNYGYATPTYYYQCTLSEEKTLVWLSANVDSISPYSGANDRCAVLKEIIK